jgi:hypothetical protein
VFFATYIAADNRRLAGDTQIFYLGKGRCVLGAALVLPLAA